MHANSMQQRALTMALVAVVTAAVLCGQGHAARRDAEPNPPSSDTPFEAPRVTHLAGLHRIVSLRADSANATGAYSAPGAQGPWKDLVQGDAAGLFNFRGDLCSGWEGDGVTSPRRLDFTGEPGITERVTIPAGSVPELQSPHAVTASMWFKTSFDGPSDRYQYLLEWVQHPDPPTEGLGMAIAIHQGELIVYLAPWVPVAKVEPNTWYHVSVAKDTDLVRIYVNGERVYEGNHSHLGIQESEIVLGASTFRTFEGYGFPYNYGDFFSGSISQFELWDGTLDDDQAREVYDADRSLYRSSPRPSLQQIVSLRADRANGTGPVAGSGSPWVDLAGAPNVATLRNFNGDATSGWQGNGTPASPYRLQFDGLDDIAAIPPASVAELQNTSAFTVQMWFRAPANSASSQYQYLIEWLQAFGWDDGVGIAVQEGALRAYLGTPLFWAPVAPVEPDAWYHFAVTKEPGEARVYVNGDRVLTAPTPNFGHQTSEIVLGASTWRGPGNYADFFGGSIAQLGIWQGAMSDSDVRDAFLADRPRYQPQATDAVSHDLPRRRGIAEQVISGRTPALSLAALPSSPAPRELVVAFTLPSSRPATLDLVDVAGRNVRRHEVGSLGPGSHTVSLGEAGSFPAGVYWLRLAQDGRWVSRRATVLH